MNDTEIIAVGKYKLISKSGDSGYNWEFISSFDNSYAAQGFWIDEILGYYCLGNELVAKTTNGGTTWLPQFYNDEQKNRIEYGNARYFDKEGRGIIINDDSDNGAKIMTTFDYGENWKAYIENEIHGYSIENEPLIIQNDKYFILFYTGQIQKNHYTIIYTLDTNFSIINKNVLDSITVLHAIFDKSESSIKILYRERRLPSGSTFLLDEYSLSYLDDNLK